MTARTDPLFTGRDSMYASTYSRIISSVSFEMLVAGVVAFASSLASVAACLASMSDGSAPCGLGLTLVHFSAQHEPFLSQKHTLHTLKHPLPPLQPGLHNPYAHPLCQTKRSSGAEKWTSVSKPLPAAWAAG